MESRGRDAREEKFSPLDWFYYVGFTCGRARISKEEPEVLGLPAPAPNPSSCLQQSKGFEFYIDTATAVWLVLCAIVATFTETVVGYPVGPKVGADVTIAYLGFATSYAHAVASGTYKQFAQLVAPVWLVFMLLGFNMMFLANRNTAITFFIQSLVSLLVATYIGYDQAISNAIVYVTQKPVPPVLAWWPAVKADEGPVAACSVASLANVYVAIWAAVLFAEGGLLLFLPPTAVLGPAAAIAMQYSTQVRTRL
jgi:hypothetical protein